MYAQDQRDLHRQLDEPSLYGTFDAKFKLCEDVRAQMAFLCRTDAQTAPHAISWFGHQPIKVWYGH